ncbi:TMN7 [Acrasis kona]|uniref:Transmembrane 9 superfamily member n=1 Tax=Acrasis kona TaxID=1008807 RepID=A0AAW2YRN6_9EUKA
MRREVLVLLLFAVTAYCNFLVFNVQKKYKRDDDVEVKTRKISSVHNVPFDFYSLKYCRPDPLLDTAENFGELLFGDRIQNSVFDIKFLQEVSCKLVTEEKNVNCPSLGAADVNDFIEKIKDDYNAQLIVDNLPVANRQDPQSCGSLPGSSSTSEQDEEGNIVYSRPDGYPVGCTSEPRSEDEQRPGSFYVNNHLSFTIKYHKSKLDDDSYFVVGAEVIPSSIQHEPGMCNPSKPLPKSVKYMEIFQDKSVDIPWSYSVRFEESDIQYASRWDAYMNADSNSDDYKIHWFSIINSMMIVLFLTGMVAMILLRILRRDIMNDSLEVADEEDPTVVDETGWKLLHGDVFRAPPAATLLSIMVGSGIQLFAMSISTLVLAFLGFLRPQDRGGFANAAVILFLMTGTFCGYYSLRFYKTFDVGTSWKTVAVLSAVFLPGTIFSAYLFVDFIMAVFPQSSIAIPFLSALWIMFLYVSVSLPLVFVGAYFGYKKQAIEHPTQIHRLPRQITHSPAFLKPWVSVLIGGILPFGAVFIELYFIMSSVWLSKFYYVFTFLFVVFNILVLTSAEITVVLTYFQLCNEDYRWWWRSYLSAGSSALYLFLYSVFYYSSMNITNVSMTILYFGYMSIACYIFFILTGTIGFLASFFFVRRIYGSIKVA